MTTSFKNSHQPILGPLALAVAAMLAACGGSGSSSVAPPVNATLTLSGTAATGAALAKRPVQARCATGTSAAAATATTEDDGKYSVAISGGARPCVLRVTATDGSVLHSLAIGTGASAAANITPVSELVLAHRVGSSAAGAFSNFDAASITNAKVQAALSAVVDTLKAAGVDVATIGNLLTA